MFEFYEFFAGGGMARAGLGPKWQCVFANDIDPKKAVSYRTNWGPSEFQLADVRTLLPSNLQGTAHLAWASFPCQDLSLAGQGAGLEGERSGTFWPFWNLICKLVAGKRAPRTVVLENVCGTLSSHGGADFSAICSSLREAGYRYGAVVVDAVHFLPQSRPRLFVIAVRRRAKIPPSLAALRPPEIWSPPTLLSAFEKLSPEVRRDWIWWNLPTPPARTISLADIIEETPPDVPWHTPAETRRLLDMMTSINFVKVQMAQKNRRRMVGAIYKRTRINEGGRKTQRAEIRFDQVAGCLRTPAGGSSRQVILVVDGEEMRSRLISGRETARLMGLPDSYVLPQKYNDAYHLTGDGVAVPVVRHLSRQILEPLVLLDSLIQTQHDSQAAAREGPAGAHKQGHASSAQGRQNSGPALRD